MFNCNLAKRNARARIFGSCLEESFFCSGGSSADALKLCKVSIATGRRHQIRCHLAYIGMPSVTDGILRLQIKRKPREGGEDGREDEMIFRISLYGIIYIYRFAILSFFFFRGPSHTISFIKICYIYIYTYTFVTIIMPLVGKHPTRGAFGETSAACFFEKRPMAPSAMNRSSPHTTRVPGPPKCGVFSFLIRSP